MHTITAKLLDSALSSISVAISRVERELENETEEMPARDIRTELSELRYDRLLIQEMLDEQAGKHRDTIFSRFAYAPAGSIGPEYDGDQTE